MKKKSKLLITISFILIVVFFMALSLGQLQKIQITKQIACYYHELIMIVFSFFITHQYYPEIKKILLSFIKNKSIKIEKYFLVFSLSSIILSAISGTYSLISCLYLLRFCAYLYFTIALYLFQKKILHSRLSQLLLGTELIIILFGIGQYLFLPDTRFLGSLSWDYHYYRLLSTFLDPNFTGLLICLTIINLEFWHYQQKLSFKLFIVLCELAIFALALTFSRASYLAFILSQIFLFFRLKWRRRIIFIFVMSLLIYLPLLPKPGGEGVNLSRTSTIEARLVTNKNIVQGKNLLTMIFGNGWFSMQSIAEKNLEGHAKIADNIFVLVFDYTGIIGIVFLLMIIFKWLKILLKIPFLAALFGSVLIHSFFNNSFFEPFILLTLLISTLTFISNENLS